MTLGIAFKGTEGIVLAADSRVTITAEKDLGGGRKAHIPATFDNAIKLLRVKGQDFVGAVTYDVGVIGQSEPRTAHSFIPEFETQLSTQNAGRLPVVDFATGLSDFFLSQWNSHGMPGPGQGADMRFLVGGYNETDAYGRIYSIAIPSAPAPAEQHPNSFGIAWGGQSEFAARLLNGFDGALLEALRARYNLDDQGMADLNGALLAATSAKVPYQLLPLQDCVDLSILLIRTTAAIQEWTVDIRGVGGAIDVAVITKTEGFVSIQHKQIRVADRAS